MASLSWADRAAMAAGEPEPSAPIMTRSATQFAMQAAERAKSQPQGEAEAAFLAAIDRIFARWTLLQLAVDMVLKSSSATFYRHLIYVYVCL